MSYLEKIQQAENPKAGMAILAEGIDEILTKLNDLPQTSTNSSDDSWSDWSGIGDVEQDSDGNTTINFNEVDEETEMERRRFAIETLDFPNNYPADWKAYVDGYAKGGPMYLYLSDRDFVMGLPIGVKNMMLTDVNKFNPEQARQMAADILKDASPGDMDQYLSSREELQS